ncbi:MAG: thiamine-binding protein [Sphingobacteriales bacterium]|nr:MAG: thiamine-binding protein [Sphingobacteriales bacterium]
MKHNVNLAIQVLPLQKSTEEAYAIIDKVIAAIAGSGMKYLVCPFETVIEGPYDQIIKLLGDIQMLCFDNGAESLLINMKLHTSKTRDMAIDDKIGKYR